MKKIFQTGLYTIVSICLLWGILVGLFTWDSSRIFPAYASLINWFMKPITMSIQNVFDKTLESKK